MSEYFILYAVICVTAFCLPKLFFDNRKLKLAMCTMAFFLIIFLIACRHPSMGTDLGYGKTEGYLPSYNYLSSLTWKQLITMESYLNYEKGYILFNKLIGMLTNRSEQWFLAICAIVSIVPSAYIIYKKSKNTLMSIIIYISVPTFVLLYSGLRQGIAVGICCMSWQFIEEKKIVPFVLCVLFASIFHNSSAVFLLAYIIYHIKLSDWMRGMTIIMLAIIFVLRYSLFIILREIYVRENLVTKDTGSFGLLLMFVLIYIFCIVFSKRTKEQNGYMNVFYVACICQIFASVHMLSLRIGYYFITSLFLLIPSICEEIEDRNTATIIKVLISIAFLAFGIYSIYVNDWAVAYPYYWFWQNIYS